MDRRDWNTLWNWVVYTSYAGAILWLLNRMVN